MEPSGCFPCVPIRSGAPSPQWLFSWPGEVLLVPMLSHGTDIDDVPQNLLKAIAWKESNRQPRAVGPTGRPGVLQLSPAPVALIEGGLLGRDLDPFGARPDPHRG